MTRRPQVRVELLGPARLLVDGAEVAVPGTRRRAILALLALADSRVVSVDALLDAVWPDELPGTGRKALQAHVSRIRGHLGVAAGRLERAEPGYRLRLEAGELDVGECRRLAERARRARGHDPAGAAADLEAALALWRGEALDEFADVAPLVGEAAALAELRRDLADDLLDAHLSMGGRAVSGAAMAAAASEPLRERTHLLLVRALAVEGRTAEAMRAAHGFRARLVDRTGLDPSPALAELEQTIAGGQLAPGSAGLLAPAERSSPGGPVGPRPARGTGAAEAPRAGAAAASATPPDERGAVAPAGPPPRGRGRRWRDDTVLVGREHELAEVLVRLDRAPLVTLTGPGGVGKSALARAVVGHPQLAGREVVEVDLAGVPSGQEVLAALAGALGLTTIDDASVASQAADRFALGRSLLVLDSCEHVTVACRDLLGRLIAACPELVVLATSREPLGVGGEHLVRLGPLPVPAEGATDPAEVGHAASVALFLAHARRSGAVELDDRTAPIVAEVVRRLDGLPLALELAAGRVGSLGLAGLRDSLGSALDLLGRADGDERHQTLRRALAWSYELLTADDRALFRLLGAFPGGVSLGAAARSAQAIDHPDPAALALLRLADASMLTAEPADHPDDQPRYRMLETVRTLAVAETEAAGEATLADRTLVDVALETSGALAAGFGTADEGRADRLLRAEVTNLRAARAAARRLGDVDSLAQLGLGLDEHALRRDLPELGAWAIELADDPALEGHRHRAELLGVAADAAWLQGDLRGAEARARAALDLAGPGRRTRRALDALATVQLFEGAHDLAEQTWLAAASTTDPPHPVGLAGAGLAAAYRGDRERALELVEEAFTSAAALGSASHLAFCHYVRGEAGASTDPASALVDYGRAAELAGSVGATFIEGIAWVGLVSLVAVSGDDRSALAGYDWLIRHWRRSGQWTQLWTTLRNVAGLLERCGDLETASLLLRCADTAPEAAAISAGRRQAHEAQLAGLDAGLGPDGVRRVRNRSMALTRAAVVDVALDAIGRARRPG